MSREGTGIIVVDTETTSRFPNRARVVEIGAVVLDGTLKEVDTFSSLCNPGKEALAGAQDALEISGLTVEEILAAPFDSIVAAEFHDFLETNPSLLCGYNSRNYDSAVLLRQPWTVPLARWDSGQDVMLLCFEDLKHRDPCPLEYLAWKGEYKWPRLEEAARIYGFPVIQDHRALSDARLTADILRQMRDDGI